jgi:Methylase of chemotaxis methyl-accepting proteins
VTDPFLVWLLGRFGLDASAYRAAALARRLPSCLRQLRVATACEAKAALELRPELFGKALNSVLIGVTEFFRDRPVFDYLRKDLLPELLSSRHGLRVLSAGCSDGQELYSIAMLLEELGALEESELLGMDCRADAIDRARAGIFHAREAAGLDAFPSPPVRSGITQALRDRCRWQVGDLLSDIPGGGWDIILCRNVAIYLNEPHAVLLWERLTSALGPDGALVVGKAEKLPPSLPLVRVAANVYRRTGE